MSTWKCKDMVASLKKNMWNRKWTCNELLECSLGQHLSFSAHRGGLTCHSAKPKVESDTAPAFTAVGEAEMKIVCVISRRYGGFDLQLLPLPECSGQ